MAFLKTADAIVKTPSLNLRSWHEFKTEGQGDILFSGRTASINFSDFSPEKFLLTHCTIIASVDVDEVPNVRVGESIDQGGKKIKRLWNNYHITPETTKYINQNGDAWERDLLLKTYRTFQGSENYVEHVQIPELSKGKIIDAVARELEDTIYIDILVATDRKHASLIADIESGEMNSLSMGCFTGSMPVTMEDGTSKPISEVQVGDRVYTHVGNTQKVQATKKTFWEEDLLHISTTSSSDPLKVTHTHPMLVVRPYASCACGCGESLNLEQERISSKRLRSRFKRGHQLRVFNPVNSYNAQESSERKKDLSDIYQVETEWVQAGLLKKGDWLVFPESQVQVEPEISLTEARLLGYYLAEGNVCKNPSGALYSVEFTFGLHERDTLVSEVETLLESLALPYSVYIRKDRNTAVVRCHDKAFASKLSYLGGEGAHLKKIQADNLLLWPSEYKKSLIGAYFNGDGTESANGVISATTVSYQLHQQIRRLLGTLGIRTSEWCRTLDKTVLLHEATKVGRQENRRLPSYKVTISKSQRFKLRDFTKWDTPTECRIQAHDDLEGMNLIPISEIERVSHSGTWVYDLQVEGDKSYHVGGYAVHNCSIQYSICTKCGNVAADDTELCEHVRYFKGDTFIDHSGKKRVIAELCGHKSDPESVTFIEASWVANPAFKGAVLRTVLNPTVKIVGGEVVKEAPPFADMVAASPLLMEFMTATNIDRYLHTASSPDAALKALHSEMRQVVASVASKKAFGFGDEEGDEEGDAEEKNFVQEVKEDIKKDLTNDIKDKIREEVKEEMDLGQPKPVFKGDAEDGDLNDTVIQSYQVFASRYASELPNKDTVRRVFLVLKNAQSKGWKSVKNSSAYGNVDILAALHLKSRDFSRYKTSNVVYSCLKKVGGTANYTNLKAFLNACELATGRSLNRHEAEQVVRIGNLLK